MSAKWFPVLGAGFSVPWELVAPFGEQARANHDQSLEQLAARGGLDESELWCVMHGKSWRERCPRDVAKAWARELTRLDLARAERERLKSIVLTFCRNKMHAPWLKELAELFEAPHD